jgi:L-erythro-3,5-diaminohexanoate dehydrogenase
MTEQIQPDRYGTHRVIEPRGVLPQAAFRLDNDFSKIYDNEMLLDVETLNIDSASFREITERAGGDIQEVKSIVMRIVKDRGKMQNPVTGSGGMLLGTVKRIGTRISKLRPELKEGDRILTLVSLSLTPLYLEDVREVHSTGQIDVIGRAVLFESGVFAKLPTDMSTRLAISVLDVAGAAPQTARLVKPGQVVLVLGAGKSGILALYAASKIVGGSGKLIALGRSEASVARLKETGWADIVVQGDATRPLEVLGAVSQATNQSMADVVVNCLNGPNTEMCSILCTKDGGTVYFFNMATSFTAATLGAEGIGKDITMIMGNGYCADHANHTLDLIRQSPALKRIFENSFV